MHSSIENLKSKNSTQANTRRAAWSLACGFMALSLVFVGRLDAGASETMPFYLPLHSEQFPQIVVRLETALQQAGISNLKVQTADYWQGYQQGLRRGRKGIYYAAPHFAAWSINQHGFDPLLKLKEPLKYVIANKRGNFQFFEINDLSKQKVCAQRALNLDYLLVNTGFDNPVLSARTVSVWSVLDEIDKPNSDCVAFAISDHAFIELAKKRPQELIRLQQGPQFNNYVFVAHPSFSTAQINKITKFLMREDIQKLMRPIYQLTSTKAVLVGAYRQDYPLNYMSQLAPYWQRKQ